MALDVLYQNLAQPFRRLLQSLVLRAPFDQPSPYLSDLSQQPVCIANDPPRKALPLLLGVPVDVCFTLQTALPDVAPQVSPLRVLPQVLPRQKR